jgi:23S rRNA pseudouridine1911/1915/1917 synthase
VTVVPPEAAGVRLDRFLAGLPSVGSRAAADRLLAADGVRVDGAPAARSLRLRGGERLRLAAAEAPPPPVALDLDVPIAYLDDVVVVVDKPAGLVTHPAPGVRGPTLVQALLGHGIAGGDDPQRPGIVHRLDRDTSGLLVVSRSAEAHRALAAAMRRREIEREYVALVHGRPPSLRGTVDAPIGRDPADPQRMAIDGRRARDAVTDFEIAEPLERHSLLSVRLRTGRTHQIRVHLAAIGHPVVGDPLYGRGGDELGLSRQFLHAARLAFAHPSSGERIELRSELPDDLRGALERARGAPADTAIV